MRIERTGGLLGKLWLCLRYAHIWHCEAHLWNYVCKLESACWTVNQGEFALQCKAEITEEQSWLVLETVESHCHEDSWISFLTCINPQVNAQQTIFLWCHFSCSYCHYQQTGGCHTQFNHLSAFMAGQWLLLFVGAAAGSAGCTTADCNGLGCEQLESILQWLSLMMEAAVAFLVG